MMPDGDYVDALRITEAEHRALLDELDRVGAAETGANQRAGKRYRYVVREGLILQVDKDDTRLIVRPRNISSSGIGLLHGSFLYPGTTCTIALKTTAGKHVLASGRIVHCRCVRGRAHEVGVQFDNPIDVEDFVRVADLPAQRTPSDGNPTTTAAYDPNEVVNLVQQLGALAADGAPPEQLLRKLALLVALLRDESHTRPGPS